jgi:hypothetical protein
VHKDTSQGWRYIICLQGRKKTIVKSTKIYQINNQLELGFIMLVFRAFRIPWEG